MSETALLSKDVLIVKSEDITKVANALSNPTRVQILHFIKEKEAEIQQIAELIGQTKANASAQIRILEDAGLVKTSYQPGIRGVKKLSSASVKEVRLCLV